MKRERRESRIINNIYYFSYIINLSIFPFNVGSLARESRSRSKKREIAVFVGRFDGDERCGEKRERGKAHRGKAPGVKSRGIGLFFTSGTSLKLLGDQKTDSEGG